MKKSVLLLGILWVVFLGAAEVQAAEVSVGWSANTEVDLAGYKVYYGTASRSYGTPIDVGNNTGSTVTNLTAGQTYYFAVTAYDTAGGDWTAPSPRYSRNKKGRASDVMKQTPQP